MGCKADATASVLRGSGLSKQNLEGFAKTLDTVLSAKPDRFAVYAYAHLPQMFKAQRQIKVEDHATPETRLELLGLTIEKLSAAGYVYIGMDHFALLVYRGYAMTRDDVIRRDVIQQIMCYDFLDFEATAKRHDIDFKSYFASELVALEPVVVACLAEFAAPGPRVLPAGRLLLRNLSMVFDAYLPQAQASGQRFSKAI